MGFSISWKKKFLIFSQPIFIFIAIKNTTLFSSSRHFLCLSGDEVIKSGLDCNKRSDCEDGSDEAYCIHCK
jgi:hypothetical protein